MLLGPGTLAFDPHEPSGSAWLYLLRVLDVGNAIDLDAALARLSPRARRGPTTLRGPLGAGAGGVLLATSPIDIEFGQTRVGELSAQVRVRLFDFGIAAVRFQIELQDRSPSTLVSLASRVEDDAGFDEEARTIWKQVAPHLDGALKEGSPIEFVEDYTVFVLPSPPEGHETLARMLLGEADPRPLSPMQIDDIQARTIRYFKDDLVVVDFDAAVIIDPQASAELVDIFELATAHLLELRYYDALLSHASHAIAHDAARAVGARWFFRSPFELLTERAARLVLEIGEMTDRFERSITLLGDTYSVQVYRTTAERFRIAEAVATVHDKLEMVARSAGVLSGHVQSRRGFVLEVLVVLLIAFEIVMAFLHR